MELVPKLHQALHEDVEWAKQNEPEKEIRDGYKFENLLLISHCYYGEDLDKCKCFWYLTQTWLVS